MPAQPSLRRFFGNQGGGAAAMPTESVRWLSEARMFIHPTRMEWLQPPNLGWTMVDSASTRCHESGVVDGGAATHSSVAQELRGLVFSCNCGSLATTAKLLAQACWQLLLVC